MGVVEVAHLGQRKVVAAQGRARVAADEGAGAQAGRPVPPGLLQGQADERLDAGEEDAPLVERVPVVEAGHAERISGR